MTGLTVVVPLYNGGAFIGETLGSLARQTVPLERVIVVDDGSTDDGPAIAEAHPLGPTVVRQQNLGVAVARNHGALRASTRHIAFLDQDDLWMPQRHERLLRFIEAHPDCEALVTTERSFYLRSDEQTLRARGDQLHRGADHRAIGSVEPILDGGRDDGSIPPILRTIDVRELLGGTVSVTTSYVFDRETFLGVGGCATFARSLDDYWALLNIARVASLLAIDEPSILYRIHPGSTTMSTSWSMPLLTSLVAARFGDNVVPLDQARDPRVVVPLDDARGFWAHQLVELARTGRLDALRDAAALVRLLGCSPAERRRVSWQLTRTFVGTSLRALRS